jgi:hypothetical protein
MLLWKKAVKLAIILRLGLAGLLIAILCLCMFVFMHIVSGSLLVAFSAIAGASTGFRRRSRMHQAWASS